MTVDADRITPIEAGVWAALTDQAVEIVGRRLDSNFRPYWRAPSGFELSTSSAELRADGTPWGENPYQTVAVANTVLIRGLLEHARVVGLLLREDPEATLTLDTLARAALEVAAQSMWLTEPGIGGRARVARLTVLRRSTEFEKDRFASRMDNGSSGSLHGAADIDKYAAELGLREELSKTSGKWVGFDGQIAKRATERAEWFMRRTFKDTPAAHYAYLCGAAHGELWRLVQGYTDDPDGPGRWIRHSSRGFTKLASMVTIESIFYSGIYTFLLAGQSAAMRELQALTSTVQDAFRK